MPLSLHEEEFALVMSEISQEVIDILAHSVLFRTILLTTYCDDPAASPVAVYLKPNTTFEPGVIAGTAMFNVAEAVYEPIETQVAVAGFPE